MPVSMVAPRNYTLRTKTGHVIKFTAGQPTLVPDLVVSEALAVNILPVENSDVAIPDDSARGVQRVVINGTLRTALILHTIHDMVRENDSENFDGGGRPKVHVMSGRCGLDVNARERSELWDKYRELIANGEDLPTHKAMDTVLAVQALTKPGDMKEYAQLLDVPEARLLGLSLREQKQVLLAQAIK